MWNDKIEPFSFFDNILLYKLDQQVVGLIINNGATLSSTVSSTTSLKYPHFFQGLSIQLI